MKVIKEIAGFIFRFSFIPLLIKNIFCRNKVTIIFYHNPKPEIFKRHIEYLSKHYNFISLNRLVDAIYEKNWSIIPKKSLVITIDDGHRCNYKLLDIIKKYKIFPTIYICSHIVSTNRKFWWMTEFPYYPILKKYDNKLRLQVLKDKVNYEQKKEHSTRQALNLEELREMSHFVDFQSHSKFHPILPRCTDEECKKEIDESKLFLERLLKKDIKHFSFPNGDYNEREIAIVKNASYKSARTYDIGWNSVNSNPFMLKAMGIENDASINILCAQVCGFFRYFRYLLHGNLKGKHPPFL